MTHTVVIGAGVAGLATATLLARDGHTVQVLERGTRVGGRAGSLERDGFRFDTGPSWYLMPEVFEHYFQLLGTTAAEQLDLRDLRPGYRVFSEPEPNSEPGTVAADALLGAETPVTVPAGGAAVRALFERLEPGSGQRLDRYLASAAHATALAQRHFLYNPFTRLSSLLSGEVLRSLPRLLPLLRGSLQRFVGRQFQHPVLRQILEYPAVFLGTDPRKAPALYHLMSALDLGEGVQYPMGGFAEVVRRLEHLARDAGVEITTQAEVTEITTAGAGRRRRVTGVRWHSPGERDRVTAADTVVSAADLRHTEKLLRDPAARSYSEAWWQRLESGPGGIIAMLGVRGDLPQLDHHSLLFTRDWNANFDAIFGANQHVPQPASIYVCKPSATDPTVAPAGYENLFILIPVPADTAIGGGGSEGGGAATVEHAVDAAIDQIAAWANIPDLRERVVVRETLGPADFAAA